MTDKNALFINELSLLGCNESCYLGTSKPKAAQNVTSFYP